MVNLVAPVQSAVDSASVTTFTAVAGHFYIIDTATAPVTVNLPSGAGTADWVTLQNAPANGAQVGGATVGNSITINAFSGETIESNTTETLGPPTSTVTAACRRYYPTGSNSGTGAGQAGITGWTTN